jgi:alpha-N-acetylglucosamine transferase
LSLHNAIRLTEIRVIFSMACLSKKVHRIVLLTLTLLLSGITAVLIFLYSPQVEGDMSEPINSSMEVLKFLKEDSDVTRNFELFRNDDNQEIMDYDRAHLKVLYPEVIDELYNRIDLDGVNWSRFAYALYATSESFMCNVMMKFAELRKHGSRASMVMLVNQEYLDEVNSPTQFKMLTEFSKKYSVKLKSTKVIQLKGNPNKAWQSSFTKLMVFNETDYDRIIYMDSDGILPNGHMDELFFIPPCRMAVPNGYWLSRGSFNNEDLGSKYPAKDFGFQAMTTDQRKAKVDKFINSHVRPFVHPESSRLEFIGKYSQMDSEKGNILQERLNQKNFYTNLYNNLPNNPFVEEFELTNIVMVIQPSPELFSRVLDALENRDKKEFDMDLVQNRVFPTKLTLESQYAKSSRYAPDISFEERLEEIPELLVLPHQVYGTLTGELNTERNHISYQVETHEEGFALQGITPPNGELAYYQIDERPETGNIIFSQVKYLHFSDSPIPKPWFKRKAQASYMSYRTRCPEHKDFKATDDRVKPASTVSDCTGGEKWELISKMFADLRKEVCGLELLEGNGNAYSVE